ncbi:hypothetical protein JCM10207_005912 [Rhodosporidiobolus poonsookiae]
MGSPPIPDRSPPPQPSTSSSSVPPAFRSRSPPRPHPGIQPARAPASVPFSPPKRRTGGTIKGKERAVDGEGDGEGGADEPLADPDFPAQVQPTYRHLLGTNNGGAANPLRCIVHIDIDAAYAAMEMARLDLPRNEPMAVQQWNGLIAVNYPARRYGITRHESPAEALKKCPTLRLVHVQTYKNGETEPGYWEGAKPETHKVSLDMYRKESRKILAVFSEFCPVVEKASIDESFLDLTLPVRKLLLERYPALASAPDGDLDAPLPSPASLGVGPETVDWDAVGNLVPVHGQKKDKVKRLNPDGTDAPPSSSPVKPSLPPTTTTAASPPFANAPPPAADPDADCNAAVLDSPDPPEPPLTWSDLCLALAAEVVMTIRAAVKERLGYTCSAGIAGNKMLAKLCSGWKKPDAQTILRHAAVPAFLRPLPFQKIRNLGGKLGTAVKETYEAETVEDLLKFSLSELKAKLGDDSGVWLWEIVRGLDYTEVETKTQVKSMLSSKNFRPYISKYSEVFHWLNILATELHLRLTEAREDSPGLWPKTITFTHRSPQFVIRSHQIPFPFTSTPSIAYILKHGEKLLRTAMGPPTPLTGALPPETAIGPYSNIQLSFSGLERLEEGQRGIEGFFAASTAGGAGSGANSAKAQGGGAAGEGKKAGTKRQASAPPPATKGKANQRDKKRKVANGSAAAVAAQDGPEELVLSSDSSDDDASGSGADKKPSLAAKTRAALPTVRCERCGKTLGLSSEAQAAVEKEGRGEDALQEAMRRVEDEHRDWHVARDLLETERKQSGWGFGSSSGAPSSSSGPSATGKKSSKEGKEGKKAKKAKKGDGTLTGFFRAKS